MAIRLYDSLTRDLRELRPGSPDGVFRFYNCGPTVYAPAHIGNFRTFLVNDVIRRLLELEFGPEKVRHVRNLTDVDDKTIRRSREEGRPLQEITLELTEKFRFSRRRLWGSLALVGSNFLDNSWVKSGCETRAFEPFTISAGASRECSLD
jgi:cysteinyl-tRNA synthetase